MGIRQLKTSAPAIEKAFAYLTAAFASEKWVHGHHLPPINRLACDAQVSRNSMWKAIGIAKGKGLVHTKKGGYMTFGQEDRGRSDKILEHRGSLWQKKRILIEQDIIAGSYSLDGRLPASKELKSRYGVCFTTLKKILNAMVRDKALIPYKKAYLLPQIVKHRFRDTITFVTEGGAIEKMSVYDQRMRELARNLEQSCRRGGVNINFVNIAGRDPHMGMRLLASLPEDETSIGFIINLSWLGSTAIRQQVQDLVVSLAARKKPVAVLDWMGMLSLPPSLAGSSMVRVFRIAARLAGQAIGRILLNLGHKNIAYISMLHQHQWSVRRLEGIVDQYEKAGLKNQVHAFVLNEIEGYFDRAHWMGNLKPQTIKKLSSSTGAESQAPYSAEDFKVAKDLSRFSVSQRNRFKKASTNLAVLDSIAAKDLDPGFFAPMSEAALLAAEHEIMAVEAEPLFERALAESSITAWVGGNDGTAVNALAYLREKGIKVPDDISVIGFDNSMEAFENQLASYDFNYSAIVHQMLSFIARPSGMAAIPASVPIEVEGLLIERKSLGKAPVR
jgi:DNA-binding LacI/PurR family transcriptional regulator/DNA-binding transcriptional regulator YhcF (GntR family)